MYGNIQSVYASCRSAVHEQTICVHKSLTKRRCCTLVIHETEHHFDLREQTAQVKRTRKKGNGDKGTPKFKFFYHKNRNQGFCG